MTFGTFCRFLRRLTREVAPEILFSLWHRWLRRVGPSLRRYRQARKRGELAPPFLFLSLTSACNLRCQGCWVTPENRAKHLPPALVHQLIESGKKRGLFFYTLLGGEPLLYPWLWEILERHRESYFQIITNGIGIDEEVAARWRRLGNVTPLVSVDGFAPTNDRRRGSGTYHRICQALHYLRQKRLFFGVATTISRDNFEEVLSPGFVREMVGQGAMYLWYYILRPMGSPETAQLCLTAEQIVEVRRRLLQLRRHHPLLIIDTYWDEKGRAICPAALGLGYHIGPEGSIEPCPPLSVASESIQNGTDPLGTILGSRFLRDFAQFVNERTRGCVILENPKELTEFLRNSGARDYSQGRLFACLENQPALPSHHQPQAEIPEDSWLYRMLKRRLFFGLAGYG